MSTQAQSQTYKGSLRLDNQAEINSFIFKEVTGDLTISGGNDLQGLLSLETIGGSLSIYSNSELTNVDGLENLKSIGKDLFVTFNSQLEDLEGLRLLSRLPGNVTISGNSSLTSLDGFGGLEVAGSLRIQNNASLVSINGLSGTTTVGDVVIYNNPNLWNLLGLSSITRVKGRLVISTLPDLENLDALSSLTQVEGGLVLGSLPKLVNLDGLRALVSVGGSSELYIGDLPLIRNLDGLSNLTSAQSLRIVSNSALENIDGLSGLSSLRSIRITNNAVLQRLPTWPSVVLLDYLEIASNPSLPSLNGLNNLGRVVNILTIENNNSLAGLAGLSALVSVGQFMKIGGNLSLTNVDGLSGLRDVGSDPAAYQWGPALEITANSSLQDLDGLSGMKHVGRDLLVSQNAVLAKCTTGLHDLIATEGVYGFVQLSENAEGCNSLAQIGIDSVTVRPGLVRPTNGDQNVPAMPNMLWRSRLPGSRRADVQFSYEPNFTSPFVVGNVPGNHFVLNEGSGGQEIFWRVRSISCEETSPWSETWRFRISSQGELDNFLVLSETSGEFERLPEVALAESTPSVPDLRWPQNGSIGVSTNTYLYWDSDQTVCAFHLQLATDPEFINLVADDSTLTESRPHIPLVEDTRYYWRVRKIGFGDYSEWSQVWWFQTQQEGPGTVSLTSPQDHATNTPAYTAFTWESFGKPDGFEIQLSADPSFDVLQLDDSTLTRTTFQLTDHLATSTTYFWRVRAYQGGGGDPRVLGPWSSTRSFTVGSIVELLAPTLFRPTCCGSSFEFVWTTVIGALEYEVELGGRIAIRTADTTATFVSPIAGGSYNWRVRGTGPNGPGPFSATMYSGYGTGPEPLAPSIIEPKYSYPPVIVRTNARFVWSRAPEAVSYQFQLSEQLDFSSSYTDRTGLVDTSLTLVNLPADTRFYLRVRGVDSEGRATWTVAHSFETAKLPYIAAERGFYSGTIFGRFDGSLASPSGGPYRGYDAVVDQQRGRLYYGARTVQPRLYREDIDGDRNFDLVQTEYQPTCIALDQMQSVLYWCEPGGHRVMRMSLDNLTPEIFLSDIRPTDLEVDPSGYLYWVSDEADQIGKTALETGETQILVEGLHNIFYVQPTGLALDPDNDALYWSSDKEIWSAGLDGSGARAILSAPAFVRDIELVRSLGKIYFSLADGWGTSVGVRRASLNGGSVQAVLSSYGLGWGLAIDDRGASQLPVELSTFDVVTSGTRAILHWSTASESNNAGFEIQHASGPMESTDWEVVGYVEGAGVSTVPTQYEFEVADLGIGAHRFRLKQIDQDGVFAFSAEVEAVVELADAVLLGEAYPNPFNPLARFRLAVPREQRVSVTLFDTVGRQVRRLFDGILPANKEHWITIDGSHLASGVYWYRADGDNFREIRSVMLLK